jgi:hypothetical protein
MSLFLELAAWFVLGVVLGLALEFLWRKME